MQIKTTNTQIASTLTILVTRRKGNEFVVKPVKGREGTFRVLGTVESGTILVPMRDGSVHPIDATGLTANFTVTEDEAMQIMALPLNGYVFSADFAARINDAEEFEGTVIEGNVWAEPITELQCEPSRGGAMSIESVERASKAAKERREAFLAGAQSAAGVPAMN